MTTSIRFELAALAVTGALLLTGCQPPPPPPVPGQPLTWQQKFYQDQQQIIINADHAHQGH